MSGDGEVREGDGEGSGGRGGGGGGGGGGDGGGGGGRGRGDGRHRRGGQQSGGVLRCVTRERAASVVARDEPRRSPSRSKQPPR